MGLVIYFRKYYFVHDEIITSYEISVYVHDSEFI